ncbi:MAG: type II toxin-antitoxin system prevent-host-death family antitoxin [Streptococcaceae bacterium]|nr:type II toxin-antitoxin system prevent-host-death family antitoxin [Streptococcaceae bacterium]
MEAVTYSNFRQNLKSVMRRVNDDAERLIVTSNDGSNIVVMSQDDYNSWQETLYLMSSEANRERLNRSIQSLENGGGVVRELNEVKDD